MERDYYEKLAEAMSKHIILYNGKLVFSKKTKVVRPLDREKLGGTATRNTLFSLKNNGAQTMTEIADNINYDRGNMTKLIDELVYKGFVRRFQKESDRRQVYVELTEEGVKLIKDEGQAFIINLTDRMENKFTEEEMLDFLEAYNKITSYFEKI